MPVRINIGDTSGEFVAWDCDLHLFTSRVHTQVACWLGSGVVIKILPSIIKTVSGLTVSK